MKFKPINPEGIILLQMKTNTKIKVIQIICITITIVFALSCSTSKDKFIPGEFDYTKNDVIRKIHVLKGQKVEIDSSLLNIAENDIEMIINKERLFVKQPLRKLGMESVVKSFTIETQNEKTRLIFEKDYGRIEDESYYAYYLPQLLKSWDDTAQINILDTDIGNIYTILNNCDFRKLPDKTISTKAKVPHAMRLWTHYAYPSGNKNEWFFIGTQPQKEKSIYKSVNYPDSVVVSEVFHLNLDAEIDSWIAYLGNFAFNPQKQIGVYGYTYYPQIRFFNMATGDTKIISLQGKSYDPETRFIGDGLDLNSHYYRNISITEEYVYFLFLGGRNWENIKEDNKNENYFVYIMKFDWYGNPIKVMKTDQFGYSFCVSDDDSFMLLYSFDKKSPVYLYNLK